MLNRIAFLKWHAEDYAGKAHFGFYDKTLCRDITKNLSGQKSKKPVNLIP